LTWNILNNSIHIGWTRSNSEGRIFDIKVNTSSSGITLCLKISFSVNFVNCPLGSALVRLRQLLLSSVLDDDWLTSHINSLLHLAVNVFGFEDFVWAETHSVNILLLNRGVLDSLDLKFIVLFDVVVVFPEWLLVQHQVHFVNWRLSDERNSFDFVLFWFICWDLH